MKEHSHKIKHISAMVVLIFCSAVFLMFMFWWIYPYKTTENLQPYEVLTETIRRGELLKYEIDYCKYSDVVPTVERQFINGLIYNLSATTAQLKKGCGHFINTVTIPRNLPPGRYYLKVNVSFKVNPIRIISKEFVTEKFTVTE